MKKALLSNMTYKCFIIIKYTYTHIIRNPGWNKVRGMLRERRAVNGSPRSRGAWPKWEATARVSGAEWASPPVTTPGGHSVFFPGWAPRAECACSNPTSTASQQGALGKSLHLSGPWFPHLRHGVQWTPQPFAIATGIDAGP